MRRFYADAGNQPGTSVYWSPQKSWRGARIGVAALYFSQHGLDIRRGKTVTGGGAHGIQFLSHIAGRITPAGQFQGLAHPLRDRHMPRTSRALNLAIFRVA